MSLNTILATTPLTSTGYHLKATGTTIGNSLIWDNGTNVGIGNTNTSYTLDVSGTGRFTNFLKVSGNNALGASSTGGMEMAYFGAEAKSRIIIGDGTGYSLSFSKRTGSANTDLFTVLDTGNVGIGTSSPNVSGQGTDQRVLTVQGVGGVWGGVEVSVTGNTSAGALNGFYGFTNAGLSAGYKLVSYIGSWLDGGGVTSGADMRFHTQPNGGALAERMRITSAGNVGIGVVPTSAWGANSFVLQLQGGALWSYNTLYLDLWQNSYYNGTNTIYQTTAEASYYRQNSGQHLWYTAPSGTAGTIATFTERMRITSGGVINFNGASVYTGAGCVNSTVSSTSDFVFSGINTNATNPRGVYIRNTNSTGGDYAFYLEAVGATKFYVTGNGVIYSTNTSVQGISDARHKENIRDLDKGLSEILLLKPRLFDWKEGKGTGNKNVMGFIAQEVEGIFPELISDWKETVDATESFKTIAMSNIIPYLTKAIQEQQAQIQNLQEQINILAK